MLNKRGTEYIDNSKITSFLIIAALLTVFSLFYADFHYKPKITGFVSYTLSINIVGSGSVSIEGGGSTSCGSSCSLSYNENTDLEILANPAPGWRFSQMEGCGGGERCILNMDQDYSITVTFTRINSGNNGGIIIVGGKTGGIPITPEELYQQSSPRAPQTIINTIYQNAITISQNARYASDISVIVSSNIFIPEADLLRYRQGLGNVRDSSSGLYKQSSKISAEYSSAIIDYYKENMVQNIAQIEKEINVIDLSLSQTVAERQENQRKAALWVLEHENLIEASKQTSSQYISKIPKTGESNIEPIKKGKSCSPLTYLIAVEEENRDFGPTGYNTSSGEECTIQKSTIYLRADYLNKENKPIINRSSNNTQRDTRDRAETIHFSGGNRLSDNRNFEAVVISKKQGLPSFNFFSSPSYSGLEDKISDFINSLVYGENEKDPSYLTGLTAHQINDIIIESKKTPWTLWIILILMIIPFILFEKLLSPHHERLIHSGISALNKKDYLKAIKKYNELASTYSNNSETKDEILNYLELLKYKAGKDKIELHHSGKGSLPLIKTNHLTNIFSHYSNVENMINHALQDLNNSPKLAKIRMPIIAKEYNRLDEKEKESLAHKYEKLVYKIRDIK